MRMLQLVFLIFSSVSALSTTFTLISGNDTVNLPDVVSTDSPGGRSRFILVSSNYTDVVQFYGGWSVGTDRLTDYWQVNKSGAFWYPGAAVNSVNARARCVFSVVPPTRPGNIYGASVWPTSDGINYYFMGGYTTFNSSTEGYVNDLWHWDLTVGYTVVSSSSGGCVVNPANVGNWPPAREGALSWVNGTDLFLYGGKSFEGYYSDVWKYNATGWFLIEDNGLNYTGDGLNTPQARAYTNSWTIGDQVYFFGGTASNEGALSDWWKYDGRPGAWTPIFYDEKNMTNAMPVYGTQGVFCSTNRPGSRVGSTVYPTLDPDWVYFFGGGHNTSNVWNDLWAYNFNYNSFAYMGGTQNVNSAGTYTGSPLVPSSRMYHGGWQNVPKSSLAMWVFAGQKGGDTFNDLWKITLSGSFSVC